MAVEKYNIGGVVTETDAFEAFADIPQNRVLMAERLTTKPATRPEIVKDLTSVDAVFEHFKPSVEMDFETEDGVPKKETLRFLSVGDFGIKGITAQSGFLTDLTWKKEQFQKLIKQLKSNKPLRQALNDPASRQNVLSVINSLIKELEQSK